MSRFRQRLEHDLRDPDFAAGFFEMDRTIRLVLKPDLPHKRKYKITPQQAERACRRHEVQDHADP